MLKPLTPAEIKHHIDQAYHLAVNGDTASVTMSLGRIWGEETLAATLPATQTAHTYASGIQGNFLLALAFLPFPILGIAVVVLGIYIIRPGIITLFTMKRVRKVTFTMVAVIALIFAVTTTTGLVEKVGYTKAYSWLYDHNINVDDLTLSTSGEGSIKVTNKKNTKQTLDVMIQIYQTGR